MGVWGGSNHGRHFFCHSRRVVLKEIKVGEKMSQKLAKKESRVEVAISIHASNLITKFMAPLTQRWRRRSGGCAREKGGGVASWFSPLALKTDTCLTAGLLLRGIKTTQVKSSK